MSAERNEKQAFVPRSDRPEVRSTLHTVDGQPSAYKGQGPDKWQHEMPVHLKEPKKGAEELFELVRGLISGSTITKSPNWSGALVIQEQGPAGFDPAQSVWATWIVPKVRPPKEASEGEWRSASWVGLDGGALGGSRDVLQAGIDQIVTLSAGGHTTEVYQAWYGWDPGDGTMPVRHDPGFPVDAGDLIHVKVQYRDGKGLVDFTNYTQKRHVPCKEIPKPDKADFKGDTAEWIIERPCFDYANKNYYQLADFGVMEFIHGGGLTANDAPISPTNGFLCEMYNGDVSPKDIISQASKDLDSVRITWISVG